MPFHSILVPTYNQSQYISAALDSILAQTDDDWEAIVVNDGSTDATKEILENYSKKDTRIKCIHKKNGGVASALNKALENVSGEWIHWLSSDDLFEPNKLATNRQYIIENPDACFFYSYFSLLREETGKLERRDLWGPNPLEEHQVLGLLYRNYISGISICVNKLKWDSVGFFDTSLFYAQDYDQWLRILQTVRGVFIPQRTVISRNHIEQGSEIFPAACYYDTAKAAIRFINKYSLPEIVPFADLSEYDIAKNVVSYALDIALDPTSFIYGAGPHPALILRILEWVYSDSCESDEIRKTTANRIKQTIYGLGHDDWSWMWKQIATVLAENNPRFLYQNVDFAVVALENYKSTVSGNDSAQSDLKTYLKQFEKVDADPSCIEFPKRPRIALITDSNDAVETDILQIAQRLFAKGARPIILYSNAERKEQSWKAIGNIPILSLKNLDMNSLPWLGEVELACFFGKRRKSPWLDYLKAIEFGNEFDSVLVISEITEKLGIVSHNEKRRVIFIERVIKGGGAEKVVLDLCQHIDGVAYDVEIWTLFDDQETPSHPGNVNFRSLSIENLQSSADRSSSIKGSKLSARQLLELSRGLYRLLTSERIRRKLRLASRLSKFVEVLTVKTNKAGNGPFLRRRPSNIGETVDFDYVKAAMHHEVQARAISKAISDTPKNTVFITVMEEATVAAWMAQASRKFKYIASLHTVESLCIPDIFGENSRVNSEKWLFKTACEQAEFLTVPTAEIATDLSVNLDVTNKNIEVVPNPINCANVRFASFQSNDDLENWKENNSGFRIVHVGRLDPQKNHMLLLETCVELKRKNKDFSVVIIGSGTEEAKLRRKILEFNLQNHVELIGFQQNPWQWMAAADILALTSEYEAFGLVLLEAMICGTAVLSVDCPAGPKEVLNNSKAGVLIENNDPIAFAEGIISLMDNNELRRKNIMKGYERAVKFDVKQTAARWETLINNVQNGNVSSK